MSRRLRVLLGAFGDPGHAFPMLALGSALVERGHEVALQTGSLELANANSIGGMADEINTARQFDMAARIIEAFSSIEHKAATEIMK